MGRVVTRSCGVRVCVRVCACVCVCVCHFLLSRHVGPSSQIIVTSEIMKKVSTLFHKVRYEGPVKLLFVSVCA